MARNANTSKYTIVGFRGLNKAISNYHSPDTFLVDMKNLNIGLGGELIVRNGSKRYDDSNGAHVAQEKPSRGAYRYSQSNGNREIVFHTSSGRFYRDQGTTLTTLFLTGLSTSDEYIRYVQWKDTLFLLSSTMPTKFYHRGAATETNNMNLLSIWGVPNNTPFRALGLTTITGHEGGFENGDSFSYRFSFDYFAGDDFLGESNTSAYGWGKYLTLSGAFVSGVTGREGVVEIQKGPYPFSDPLSLFPGSNAKSINIYRTAGKKTTDVDVMDDDPDERFYFLGSISFSDFNATPSGNVLFTDKFREGIDTSRWLKYNYFETPPQCRYAVEHRDRMLYFYTSATENENFFSNLLSGTSEGVIPYRVYISEHQQPASVHPDNWLDIGSNDGEPITGAMSWRGEMVLVWKENSLYGLLGIDRELPGGIPDVTRVLIDNSIGCIAPHSIASGDGKAIWWSNEGIVYFDGSGVKKLDTELIDPILEGVPGHRRLAAIGEYVNHKKEYWLAITEPSVGGDNAVLLKYSFKTRTWTRHRPGAICDMIVFNKGGEEGKVLGFLDSAWIAGGTLLGFAVEMEEGSSDFLTNIPIPWSGKTVYIDCGSPYTEKLFIGVYVQARAPDPITMAWDVDTGDVNSSETIASTGDATWNDAALAWNDGSVWQGEGNIVGMSFKQFGDGVNGKAMQLTFSGQSISGPAKIERLIMVYKIKDRHTTE